MKETVKENDEQDFKEIFNDNCTRVKGNLRKNNTPRMRYSKAEKTATAVFGLLTGIGIYTVIDWIIKGVGFLTSLLI